MATAFILICMWPIRNGRFFKEEMRYVISGAHFEMYCSHIQLGWASEL